MGQRQNIQRLHSLLVQSFAYFHVVSTAWDDSHKKKAGRTSMASHSSMMKPGLKCLAWPSLHCQAGVGSPSTARWLNEGGGRTKTSGSKPEKQINKVQFSI